MAGDANKPKSLQPVDDKPQQVEEENVAAPGTKSIDRDRTSNSPQVNTFAPQVNQTNNYLLLIAIDKYKNKIEGIKDLNLDNPIADANAFLNILTSNYTFAPEDTNKCVDLRHSDSSYRGQRKIEVYDDKYVKCLYNEQATVDNITNAIIPDPAGLTQCWSSSLKESDNIIIYFSCHGIRSPNGKSYYIIPHDYDGKIKSLIDVGQIVKSFEPTRCKNLLLIIDCCFAGSTFLGPGSQQGIAFSRKGLTSCSTDEEASDGKPREGSPFSQNLIKILQENKEKQLSIDYIYSLLKNEFTASNQTIRFDNLATDVGTDTFIFERKNADRPQTNHFVEDIVNYLNFSTERNNIKAINLGSGLNSDYYIISSCTGSPKLEKLRGTVISKTFARKIRQQREEKIRLIKTPIKFVFELHDISSVETAYTQISKFFGQSNTVDATSSTTKDNVATSVTMALQTVKKGEVNPVCLILNLKNYNEIHHAKLVSDFIISLIEGVETVKKKQANIQEWDPLIIHILSEIEPNVVDSHYFSENSNTVIVESFNKKSIQRPYFKTFPRINALLVTDVEDWLIEMTLNEEHKQKLKSIDCTTKIPEEGVQLDSFLDEVVKAIYTDPKEADQIFEIIFFK